MCRPTTLQSSVAIAMCRKTCFPQIVLLQCKAKPYPDFQNLESHCKILGCHFDTHKRLKKHCSEGREFTYSAGVKHSVSCLLHANAFNTCGERTQRLIFQQPRVAIDNTYRILHSQERKCSLT